MRTSARTFAAAFAAALFAAPALGAQTPTTTPGTGPGTTSTGTTGGTRDSAMRGGMSGMDHGAMGHGATGQGQTGRATSRRGGISRQGGMDDGSLVARVDSVNTAAKSGLTSVPPAVAVGLIRGIETSLRGTRNGQLRSIAADLAALRVQLNRSTVNGRSVGTILARVGPKVTRVARTQSGPVATTLTELGEQLTTAGRSLRAGAAAGAASGQ